MLIQEFTKQLEDECAKTCCNGTNNEKGHDCRNCRIYILYQVALYEDEGAQVTADYIDYLEMYVDNMINNCFKGETYEK